MQFLVGNLPNANQIGLEFNSSHLYILSAGLNAHCLLFSVPFDACKQSTGVFFNANFES